MSEYLTQDPTVVEREAQPYVGIRQKVTMSALALVADRIPELFGWLGAHGGAPAGAPFFRYHVIDMEHELDVEAGIPVAAPIPGSDSGGPVRAGVLPAGRYLTVPYTGHPDNLVWTTRDLLTWAADHGLTFDHRDTPEGDAWASRVEFYETDPAVEPNMDKWTTVLSFKLAD